MLRTAAFALAIVGSFSVQAAQPAPAEIDLAKAKTLAGSVCVACHGPEGNSAIPANPIIAGQLAEYTYKQLVEFKPAEGKPAVRNNPVMSGIASTLTPGDMKSLAVYFSQQKTKPAFATDAKLVETGRNLWRKGDFERGVPACAGCHGAAGAGVPAQYPNLAGQHAEYTALQLKNFRSEERSNDAQRVMRSIADKLSDKQIKALADYIAGLR